MPTAAHGLAAPQWPGQWRSYRSLKKSMKPVYRTASRLAAKPYLPKPTVAMANMKQKYRSAPIVDTVVPEIPEVPLPPDFKVVGVITAEYQLEVRTWCMSAACLHVSCIISHTE